MITTGSISMTSIHIASQHVRAAIVKEFGDRTGNGSPDEDIELEDRGSGRIEDHQLQEGSCTENVFESGGTTDGFEITEASPIHGTEEASASAHV
jgi:hypothetical protein